MAGANPSPSPMHSSLGHKLRLYWELVRPFTLVAPSVGMLSGGLTAIGATTEGAGRWSSAWGDGPGAMAVRIAAGALMAALLNGFSNTLNQICDVDVDRINKPQRPLCEGRISLREAWIVTVALLVVSLLLALLVGKQCFVLAAVAAVFTWAYSAEPLRTKKRGMLANLTVAIPRGVLLKVCGWSTVKTILTPEPWIIGAVFGLFLLGATTTKDYADMKGDAAGGCRTLPLIYGVRRSAWMISPFFVLPFVGLVIAALLGWFTGDKTVLIGLGVVLALWGVWVVQGILRDPDALAGSENHPSWRHMYLMMFALQAGFALAYWVRV